MPLFVFDAGYDPGKLCSWSLRDGPARSSFVCERIAASTLIRSALPPPLADRVATARR
jgi:hypothetical protein